MPHHANYRVQYVDSASSFLRVPTVTEIPKGMVGRDGLVIKHESAAELMRRTRCDEGQQIKRLV